VSGQHRVVLVTGLSGSGKSTAMAALEDAGFYGADNLPAPLVERFLELCAGANPPIERVALAPAAREPGFLRELPAVIERLRAGSARIEMIFLEAADQVLVSRYRETRRVHPLAPQGPVERGIALEREMLRDVAALADHVLDSSNLNVHQLRAAVVGFAVGGSRPVIVNLVSFGFRYGTPEELELLFDVRFLPNPYFEDGLRPRSGSDPEVSAYVLENPRGAAFLERLSGWLEFLLPLYDAEGRPYVTIGFGCTGGRHRSVAIAEALAAQQRRRGREVNVEHRDVEKGS
jgi:UPF0042 nucleotide-binding protein